MGYSTTDGPTGKGLGSITTTPSTQSDFMKLIELIGRMGNKRVGTTAERTALTGASLYNGLEFYDTTTGEIWRRVSGAWKTVGVGEWVTYTPTLTNIGLGTGGANTCEWRREGDLVRVRFLFKLGTSGGSVSGIPTFTLPVTAGALQHDVVQYAGAASLYDVSATVGYSALVGASPASTTSARVILAGGTNGIYAPISSTAPFTWAANDAIAGEFTYKPA